MTAGQQTQAEAFAKIKEEGLLPLRRFQVYALLHETGSMTSGEVDRALSRQMGIWTRSASPRLNELVKLGVARELEPRICGATGMTVLAYEVVPGALPDPNGLVVANASGHDLVTREGRAAALVAQLRGRKRPQAEVIAGQFLDAEAQIGREEAMIDLEEEESLANETGDDEPPLSLPPAVIDCFRGKYVFLSNFFLAPLQHGTLTYATVEHLYQASKAVHPTDYERIRTAPTPAVAKRLGRRIPCRPDWEDRKIGVMVGCLRLKFAEGSELARQLLATGTARLVEGNSWGDRVWGVYRGVGQNLLGKLLEARRAELARSSRDGRVGPGRDGD